MRDFFGNKAIWEKVRSDPGYAPLLSMLNDGYEKYCKDKEIPTIKFSDEMEFLNEGTRTRFEEKYFFRRAQLTVYAMLALIYPEREDYLINLQDIICEICNEYSWQVPAHRSNLYKNRRDGIALFSAETGLYLAEIKQLFIERLNPLVTERITKELDFRILKSFENELTGIEIKSVTNNWASVLGCCIGLTFMYEAPERFYNIFNRIEKHMELYLKGVNDEGATAEGVTYWNYGFCFYLMYYDMLKKFTKGRMTEGLEKEKVKKMAEFFTSLVLDRENTVSFGDSSKDSGCHIWLMHFLKKEYGADMPPATFGELSLRKFSAVLRAFIYYDPKAVTDGMPEGECLYKELQWYIKRSKNYAFAVKGGHNDPEDNHNHNDIGSFILIKDGKQIFCDIGSPVYTATNFGATRYSVLNNSSLGHDVPIINGMEQVTGKDRKGKLEIGDIITVDIKNAYPVSIEKFLRHFELSENEVILTDEFDRDLNVTERFVSEAKPVADNGRLLLDGKEVIFSPGWSFGYEEHEITAHDGVTKRKIFLIDFSSEKKTDRFVLKIKL